MAAAALQDRVDHGGGLARFGAANEQPVLHAQLGRAHGLFGEVVVDPGFAMLEDFELASLYCTAVQFSVSTV